MVDCLGMNVMSQKVVASSINEETYFLCYSDDIRGAQDIGMWSSEREGHQRIVRFSERSFDLLDLASSFTDIILCQFA